MDVLKNIFERQKTYLGLADFHSQADHHKLNLFSLKYGCSENVENIWDIVEGDQSITSTDPRQNKPIDDKQQPNKLIDTTDRTNK